MRESLTQDILIPCKCMPNRFSSFIALSIVYVCVCLYSSHFITALLEMTMQMYL